MWGNMDYAGHDLNVRVVASSLVGLWYAWRSDDHADCVIN